MAKNTRKSSGRMASKGFPNPIDVHIGAVIRARRTVLGISQEKLGDLIGLTFQQVQKYERGTNRISGSRIFDAATALGVEPGYFFKGMGSEITSQSPASLNGKAPTAEVEQDEMSRRETLELVRAFYKISDEKTRKAVTNMVRAIGRSE